MLGGSMPRDCNSQAVWWYQVNYEQKMFFSPSLFRIVHLELISMNSLAVALLTKIYSTFYRSIASVNCELEAFMNWSS